MLRLSLRPTGRLREASPIASAPIAEFLRTAEDGMATSTSSARHLPAYQATCCVAAPTTLPRCLYALLKTRRSAAPASPDSERHGAILLTAITSTTATTRCGAHT